jgi:hypothetical protein
MPRWQCSCEPSSCIFLSRSIALTRTAPCPRLLRFLNRCDRGAALRTDARHEGLLGRGEPQQSRIAPFAGACIFLELYTQSPGDFARVDALGGHELLDYPLLVLHQTRLETSFDVMFGIKSSLIPAGRQSGRGDPM